MSWIFNIFSSSKESLETSTKVVMNAPTEETLDTFECICGICGENDHSSIQCHTFRTKICWHWEKGFCNNGDKCIFAHGPNELRVPPEMKHDQAILFRKEKLSNQ